MIFNEEVAKEIISIIGVSDQVGNMALKTIKDNQNLKLINEFSDLLSKFKMESFLNIISPIWKNFPEMLPSRANEPDDESRYALTDESTKAIRLFISDTKESLELIEKLILDKSSGAVLSSDGIHEVSKTMQDIVHFLEKNERQP
ncbi:hypothetical protein ACFOLJ_17195 [Rugamonas sp. CCM 8940]|uniref:hypothetical protein n=1 Tax=Rugamonas sp. CCM 8940 TaxID=2765359 RepID=UPI0018F281BE|nr:hypothetical protein [Rugamonas sp. CCM 8940]MBJ7308614.1 hypothetical protein [Rugamonas sp. CCM 8940]